MNKNNSINKKKGIHPLILLVIIVILAGILTYIIPSGSFTRAKDVSTGRITVVPGSFKFIEQTPVSVRTLLVSIQKGMVEAGRIVSFLLLIGGGFGILTATGAVKSLMARFIIKFKSKRSKNILIFGLLSFFATCAAIFGMQLEGMVFAPFLIALTIAIGYDALVGISIILLGSAVGYGSAFLSPSTLGIAQSIAELPYLSGMTLRIIFFIICVTIAALYIINYANKIKKDPSKSLCKYTIYEDEKIENPEDIKMSKPQLNVLLVFVFSIGFLIYGAMFQHFFLNECATVFLCMGIIAGFVYGMKPSEIAENFVNGAKFMVLAALIVGCARAIVVVLESGNIIDTIIYSFTQPLKTLSPTLSAPLMVIVQTLTNFFINSGSGQAVVVTPIMIPIADLINVNRQVAILAYQSGDGFSNMFWITSGFLMAGLGIAKISYIQWIKFSWKILLILITASMLMVSFAQYINWGPL